MRRLGPAIAAAVLLLAVGCGGDDGDDAADEAQDAAEEAVPGADDPVVDDGADEGDAVDACGLLEEAEIAPYVPATGPGSGGDGVCSWENPDTFESVTITVGEPGTAVDDLPEPSPYPDAEPIDGVGADARYSASNGLVEFVADGRTCDLQVASVTLDEAAQRAAAIELANLALGRI
jgi:hypothetical protein